MSYELFSYFFKMKSDVLSITIDEHLSWSCHIDRVCTKILQLIGVLFRMRHFLDFKTKIMFYNSYILPHIDYGINMWGNSAACYIKRIQILQNKAARIILNADWYTSSHVLLTQLKWMSISQRKNYHICLLKYKLFNGLGACFFIGRLRSLVVRALERYSKDPGSSPGGDACFSH